MPPRTPTGLLLLVPLGLTLLLCTAPVGADPPTVIENSNASRTVLWEFVTGTDLTLQDVELAGNRLVLPWQEENISWASPDDFEANGTFDANVTASVSGLELAENPANHVGNGNFTSNTGWAFADGPSGEVIARWDAAPELAVLGHDSASTEAQWDSMDDIVSNWVWNAPVGTLGGIVQDTNGEREGTGRLGMNIDTTGGGTWGSGLRGGTVDWSGADRLVVWVEATDLTPPLTFNITATVAGMFRTTAVVPLAFGWQELSIDLSPLGTSAQRSALSELRFRVNAVNAPSTWVYFDDARLATIKRFDESAYLTQFVGKPNETTPRSGSGFLSFDWSLVNASGIVAADALVNLSGPSGFFEASFARGVPVGWQTFAADVSATTALPGGYVLFFRFRVAIDNTSESHGNLRLDNVNLRFPDRQNGTYESAPVSLGMASQFLNVSWSSALAAETAARVSLRSGNGTDTGDPSWSAWAAWASPGRYPLSFPGADHVQVRVELNSTNASRSPLLHSLSIDTRHRTPHGTVITSPFSAAGDFDRWGFLGGSWTGPPSTGITFEIGNGSSWTAVSSSGNISSFRGPVLLWRATLSTADGLATPELVRVEASYEFLGEVDHVRVTTAGPLTVQQGGNLHFNAVVVDAGGHAIDTARVAWSTDDPEGAMLNDGTYRAGRVGEWNVTATVIGLGTSGSVKVRVTEAPLWAALFPYSLAVVGILAAGFVGYELVVRRMFAIDDVFLISKDGRLIMHNTRRMRADRDADILSGMLTAILSFVRDADPEENGELRRFDLGGKTTLLERGKSVFVSAVYSGRVPRWAAKDLRRFVADLEARFGTAFASWNGAREDLPDLKEATRRFVSHARYRSPRDGNGRLGGHAS